MLHSSLFTVPLTRTEMPPEFAKKAKLRFNPRHDKLLRELVKVFHKGSGLVVDPQVPRPGTPQRNADAFSRTVTIRCSTTLKMSGYKQLMGIELTLYRLPGLIPFLMSEYVAEMNAVFHESPNKLQLGWVHGRYVSQVVVRAAQSELGIRINNGTLIGNEDGTGLLSNK